ncbi:hypothetical protein SAMN05216352_101505 [Alteribacillus bidgolensis]|uniref:Uncharacterized protein n=1 Tax=Alteribacillus bidgolensis TaxID=930129 RepID=A0A1G8CZX0_9BACI|nr:hypothetical protein SAMN05216352_101505 [Alteribacillus bidgolensis]
MRFQKDQGLYSLQQIEKAIGNVEKAFQSHGEPVRLPEGKTAIEEAKEQLQQAWEYHLKN